MVARVVRDDEAAGSNPVTPTLAKVLWPGKTLGRRAFVNSAAARMMHSARHGPTRPRSGRKRYLRVALVTAQEDRPLEVERFYPETLCPFQRLTGQHIRGSCSAVVCSVDGGLRGPGADGGLHGQKEGLEVLANHRRQHPTGPSHLALLRLLQQWVASRIAGDYFASGWRQRLVVDRHELCQGRGDCGFRVAGRSQRCWNSGEQDF